MMRASIRMRVLTLAACVLSAVAVARAADAPDQQIAKMFAASKGHPEVFFQHLPASYQKDVQGLVNKFGEKMDADLWGQVVGVLSKLTSILKDKKQFFLNQPMPPEAKENVTKSWDDVVGILEVLTTSELKSTDGLKKLDVNKFLSTSGAKIAQHGENIQKVMGPAAFGPGQGLQGLSNLAAAKVTLVSNEADAAEVKIEMTNGESQSVKLKQVDGKWLAADMVDQWQENMAQANAGLDKMAIPPEAKQQVMMVIGMADGMLTGLQNAKTQQEFDAALAAVKQMAGGMMPGMGPGPGPGVGPGPGAGPPGGAPIVIPQDANAPPAPAPVPGR